MFEEISVHQLLLIWKWEINLLSGISPSVNDKKSNYLYNDFQILQEFDCVTIFTVVLLRVLLPSSTGSFFFGGGGIGNCH